MSQAEYARLRALVGLRLAELREGLDRHEQSQHWEHGDELERVDGELAGILERLATGEG